MSEHQFHDLRRYAAMRLVRAASRSEAMGLLGHETEPMFVRHALNDVPALERAVEKLNALDGAAASSLSEDLSESSVHAVRGMRRGGAEKR